MNELMNKVMAVRDEVGDAWKTPSTLDCLRLAAKSANELRYLWMRQQDTDRERDDSMVRELADTVIMLLTAWGVGGSTNYLPAKSYSNYLFDLLCSNIEFALFDLIFHKPEWVYRIDLCLNRCQEIADDLGVTLDDIVKARLKGIARRNGFDVGIVDNIWLRAEMLAISDKHKPHRHYRN